jgi:hypothetical protein
MRFRTLPKRALEEASATRRAGSRAARAGGGGRRARASASSRQLVRAPWPCAARSQRAPSPPSGTCERRRVSRPMHSRSYESREAWGEESRRVASCVAREGRAVELAHLQPQRGPICSRASTRVAVCERSVSTRALAARDLARALGCERALIGCDRDARHARGAFRPYGRPTDRRHQREHSRLADCGSESWREAGG